jgi:MoaA/NifB/PqqE/SkfB family radical SAM enzyme
MDCKFCFSKWRNNTKQLPLNQVLYIIDKLKEHGLEAINLTGGDPLLRDDILQICKHCKSVGLMTIISTNGIKLMENREILNYIDAINLPLDSYNPNIHNEMRPCAVNDHHKLILELIHFLNTNYPTIKIKVNTMVGKPNLGDITGIGSLIDGKVYSWKLSKFLSSGFGKNYSQEFDIGENDFEKVVNTCKELYKKSNIIDQEYKIKENELFNIFIDGYGHVNVHTKSGIKDYGTIDNFTSIEVQHEVDNLRKDYLDKVYR